MPSAGYLIYSGVMPLLKMFITIFFGWILAWKGLFTPAASKGTSQLTMNIALPSLIFSSIVPAFTSQNVAALGPLLLLAFFYMCFGLIFGLAIREICFVPRNFWAGVVVATALSNWGNLPNSIVLSVTQNPPFDPTTDPSLGVSYVSIFTVAYNIVFWVFGGARVIAWDYLPDIPQDETAYRRVSWQDKPIGIYLARVMHLGRKSRQHNLSIKKQAELQMPELAAIPNTPDEAQEEYVLNDVGQSEVEDNQHHDSEIGQITPLSVLPFRSRRLSANSKTSNTQNIKISSVPSVSETKFSSVPLRGPKHSDSAAPRAEIVMLKKILITLRAILNPITSSMIIALPIALVPPLKALFVDATASGGPSFHGPDGKPPLAFIVDTASFVGDITIPMSLVLLGASFARMQRPRNISQLPVTAIIAVTVVKLALLPLVGILLVQGLVARQLIPKDAKAERFVGMLLSGTPSAVNQVIVSQLYAKDGDIGILSAFLLVQYVVMFLSSAAITSISLALI